MFMVLYGNVPDCITLNMKESGISRSLAFGTSKIFGVRTVNRTYLHIYLSSSRDDNKRQAE